MKQPKLPRNAKSIIDELGRADRRLKRYRSLLTRHNDLKRTILGWFDTLPPGVSSVIDGDEFAVSVSAKKMERSIVSMQRVLAELGPETFFQVVTVPLKSLEAKLPTERVEKLVETNPTGPRTLTVSQRAIERKQS